MTRPGLVLLLSCTLAAQQVGQNASVEDNGTTTIKVSTELVVEAVVVHDKKGNPVPGLTVKDFTLTEDGVPQTIRFCEHQELPNGPGAEPTPANVTVYDRLARTRIAPEV